MGKKIYICEYCRTEVTERQLFCHECGGAMSEVVDKEGLGIIPTGKLYGVVKRDVDLLVSKIKETFVGYTDKDAVVALSRLLMERWQ